MKKIFLFTLFVFLMSSMAYTSNTYNKISQGGEKLSIGKVYKTLKHKKALRMQVIVQCGYGSSIAALSAMIGTMGAITESGGNIVEASIGQPSPGSGGQWCYTIIYDGIAQG